MGTKLYELKNSIESKLTIDVNEIDGIDFHGNFHLYLLKFPNIKVLVYDYLKRIDHQIKLSDLHALFIGWQQTEYFSSPKHEHHFRLNANYSDVYEKYVNRIGKHLWVEGPMRYNSYIFDAKYLLLGEYQKYAAKGLKFAFAGFTHPAGPESFTRSITNRDASNAMKSLFEDKQNIEDQYFGEVLKQFNQHKPDFLQSYGYSNYIEIYDKISELLFKVTLNRDNFHTYEIVFPTKRKNKSRKLAIELAFNFVIKHKSVSALLNNLINEQNRILTNKYLVNISSLKNRESFSIYINSMSAVLNDMINRNESTFIKYPRLNSIFVRQGMIETNTINVSSGRNYLRIARNINYNNHHEQVQLKSFYVKGSVEEMASELFFLDCINIVDRKHNHDLTEYRLISENKLSKSKMFLREPVKNILNELFDDYESIQSSLENEAESLVINKEKIADTRKTYEKSTITTLNEIRFMNKYEDKYIDIPKYAQNGNLFIHNRKIAKKLKFER